jgi:hypothetical protein
MWDGWDGWDGYGEDKLVHSMESDGMGRDGVVWGRGVMSIYT